MENRVDYWSKRWEADDAPWHKKDVNRFLESYFSQVVLNKQTPCRIFVPLCGKSLDIKWIYDQGHEVVGLDGVEKPIVEFFEEQQLPYKRGEDEGVPFFSTEDGRLKIYHCDLFAMQPSVCGKFDGVWDRGSLVAIFPEDRLQYASLLKSLLNKDFAYLIDTMDYDQSKYAGPPRSVPVEEIKQLFGDTCDFEILLTVDTNADPTSPASTKVRWNLDVCYEIILMLRPKSV